MKMRAFSVGVLAILFVGVAGCGDDDGSSGQGASGTSASTSSTERFNDADVEFAQGMIPHHQQAVEMAEIALASSQSPDVKAIAERIKAAQDPEIETLTTWLDEWGEPLDAGGGHDMGNMGDDDMGMMSDEDMDALREASGADLDRMFVTMMIEHHRGAIDMAKTEVSQGQNGAAKDLAQRIIDTQEAEIAELTRMQSALD